ncbi:hypothetical protein K501DRAFT_270428 [Backusella circina FSU 941]|nr:hypothetical protein K501DRAFT_270428 [Backusella circina FSU 941]
MTEWCDFETPSRDDSEQENPVLPLPSSPKKSTSKIKEKLRKLDISANDYISNNDKESNDDASDDGVYVEFFTFAKNIKDPHVILTEPSDNSSKPKDYLRIIGRDTNTECSLRHERKSQSMTKSEENFDFYHLSKNWNVQYIASNEVREAPDGTPIWGENGFMKTQTNTINVRSETSWSNPEVTWIATEYNHNYPTLSKNSREVPVKTQYKKNSSSKETNKRIK